MASSPLPAGNKTILQSNSPLFKALSSLISAALVILAAPPFDLWPLAFVSLIPFCLAVKEASLIQAFFLGWLFGFLTLLGGTTWWVPLLERFAQISTIESVGIAILLSAYQGLTYAIWAFLAVLFSRYLKVSWLISGPLSIALAEVLIAFHFKMYLGITLWKVWPLLQVAEIGGPPAVSALLVLANILFAESLPALKGGRLPEPAIKIAGIIFLVIVAIGSIRAGYVSYIRNKAPKLQVGIVQPNFGIVSVRERERHGKRYLQTLGEATLSLAQEKADLIIWPESSWPYLFDRSLKREYPRNHPWQMRSGTKVRLLLGALTHTFGGSEVYNSAILISQDGDIAGRYDKNKLVPFAEEIPFADRYPERAKRIRKRTPDWPDIVHGESPKILEDNELRIGPLICSEDIDMDYVHAVAKKRPNLLVSIVSDAWFGDSGAPRQHYALSVFRAIETRRDLVRGTNTGVSAIVDALGRIQKESPLFDVSKDSPKPPTLMTGEAALLEAYSPGPYLIEYFPLACLFILLASAIYLSIFVKGR